MKNTCVTEHNCIDLIKFVMAFIVIAIHVHPFYYFSHGIIYSLYELLCSCAVPFYFMVTGYMLCKKIKLIDVVDEKLNVIGRTIKKLSKLYVVWTVIYFPLALYDYWTNTVPFWRDVLIYVRNFFTVGEHYNSWILWYFVSSIYALVFVYYLEKNSVSIDMGVLIGMAVYFFGQLITLIVTFTWSGDQICLLVVQKFIRYTIANGRMFNGFLYIPLGMYLYQNCLSRRQGLLVIISAVVLWLIMPQDVLFVRDWVTVMMSIGIFVFANTFALSPNKLYRKLRSASKVMFFSHLLVWTLCYEIMYQKKTYGMMMYAVVIGICLCLSYAYICLARIEPNENMGS